MGLAEWIIDDTCFIPIYFRHFSVTHKYLYKTYSVTVQHSVYKCMIVTLKFRDRQLIKLHNSMFL